MEWLLVANVDGTIETVDLRRPPSPLQLPELFGFHIEINSQFSLAEARRGEVSFQLELLLAS
jgi:hypothetical protein